MRGTVLLLGLLLASALVVLSPATDARPNGQCGVVSPGIHPPVDFFCSSTQGDCVVWMADGPTCLP